MKHLTLVGMIVICGRLFLETSNAQSTERPPMYLGAHLGAFVTSQDGFKNTYNSNAGFAFGGGVGLPLSQHLVLLGDVTYFAKSGVPEITTYLYSYDTVVTRTVSTRRIGTAKFQQVMVNGGLQYKFFLSELSSLGISLGASYSSIKEDITSPSFSMNMSATGVWGYFAGVSVERRLEASPFGLFANVQYSHAQKSFFYFDRNYGGVNLSLGARFYFSYRR